MSRSAPSRRSRLTKRLACWGEMVVEKLETAVGGEREGTWALGQVE